MAFEGFPPSGLAFLHDLAANNDRDWFEAHRKGWDEEIVPAMLAWCEELAQRLRRDAMPNLVFVPRVGGSLYRPVRDVRFSRDKRPYKTYSAALLWEGTGEKHDSPGLYLQVSAGEVLLAGGIWQFEEARIDRFRKKLLAEKSAARLEEALAGAKTAGMKIDGPEKLARPPRGFGPEHPRAELSRHKGLVVAKSLKPGPWLHTREALDRSEEVAHAYAPLHAWMRDELC
jgi:uncharacterized protein (TIGR02453 family)